MDPVAAFAEAVLRDLGSDIARAWRYDGLARVEDAESDTERWATFSTEPDLVGDLRVWLSDPDDHQVVLLKLADDLQNEAVESALGWGRPLPPCDLHPHHPLFADLVDEQVWWHGPETRGPRRPVGAG